MASRWSEVIIGFENTSKLTIDQIHAGDFEDSGVEEVKRATQQACSGAVLKKKLLPFDPHARQGKDGETDISRS